MIQPNREELSELSNGDLIYAVKLMSRHRSPTYVEEELLKRLEQLVTQKEPQHLISKRISNNQNKKEQS